MNHFYPLNADFSYLLLYTFSTYFTSSWNECFLHISRQAEAHVYNPNSSLLEQILREEIPRDKVVPVLSHNFKLFILSLLVWWICLFWRNLTTITSLFLYSLFYVFKSLHCKVLMQGKLFAVPYTLRTILKPVLSGRNL